jgi:integrase
LLTAKLAKRAWCGTQARVIHYCCRAWFEVYPAQLKAHHVTSVVADWRGYAAPTRYCYHQQLRVLLRELVTYGAPSTLPGLVPCVPKPGPRLNVAGDAELETLLAAASPAVRLAMLLAAEVGIRSGTIARLSPREWCRERKVLIFRSKFGTTQEMPTTPAVDALLDIAVYGQSANCIVPFIQLLHGPGVVTTAKWLQQQFRALKVVTGVGRGLTYHDLRRTVAHRAYEKTHDVRVVQSILGHQDLAHTFWYLGQQVHSPDRKLMAELAANRTEEEDYAAE